MNDIRKHIAATLPLLLLLVSVQADAAVDDEMLSILKELRSEIKSLKSQAEKANARISELEKQLAKGQNQASQTASQQSVSQDKPATLAQTSTASTAAPIPATAEKPQASAKPPVTAGDVKGTFKIPGTDTSVGLGGFVKADLLFNSVSAGSDRAGDYQLIFSDIPVGSDRTGEHSQMTFIAKDSRLWLKSFTPNQWADISTYIEFDFNGDLSPYGLTPRLRHAYASAGNFLVGQTWTTYLNVSALPDHLDIANSAGAIAKLRQPLIRWTQPFNWQDTPMELEASLEAPRSIVAREGEPISFSANDDRYPDLVARVNFNPEWGNLSVAALGRQISIADNTGAKSEAWGGGVNLAGKINTIGLDNLRFMANFGNGAGRYTIGNNAFEDAALSSSTSLELVTTYGGALSYQHWWSKEWRSSLTYGYTRADQPSFSSTALNRQLQSIHANLLWSPISQAILGVEYVYAIRELINGQSGDLHRVQFSARYNF